MRAPLSLVSPLVAVGLLGTSLAHAAPSTRVAVTQRGDFVLLGNTLGYDCAAGTPAPLVGTVGGCGAHPEDSAPDLFWNDANASTSVTAAEARSTAVLTLPAGAHVSHAYLYWAATSPDGTAGAQATLERVGQGAFTRAVVAAHSFTSTNNAYESVADITTTVQQAGAGSYRVSGVRAADLANVDGETSFAGWAMVVFYERAADPLRRVVLFDGLDAVSDQANQTATLSGFLIPNAGIDGKLGVIAYEGDNAITGDQLFFNGGAPLSSAENPADNVFNGTRSTFGVPTTMLGDLPQLTGTPQSLAGVDLDVFDITSKLSAGQTSATIQAT